MNFPLRTAFTVSHRFWVVVSRNSRITEAEDRISESEDRMVEINETERKKEFKKEMRTTSETSGTMLNTPTLES